MRSKQKQQMTMNRNKDQRTLTKAEMEIMNIIWSSSKEELSVRDVLEAYQEPKPAYTTVATFMKILTQKGFLEPQKREGGGKTLFFAPLITQDEYRDRVMSEVKDNFFGGSVKSLVSYFMKEERLSSQEMDELMELIKNEAVGM